MKEQDELTQLGDGSYILNQDAPNDILLSDAAEWIAHAWYLADDVSRRVSMMHKLPEASEIKNKLNTTRIFCRMSVQCLRLVRRRLQEHEAGRQSQ